MTSSAGDGFNTLSLSIPPSTVAFVTLCRQIRSASPIKQEVYTRQQPCYILTQAHSILI